MSKVKTVKGVGWDVSAIGNGLFSFLTLLALECHWIYSACRGVGVCLPDC
jgi:hypothetical protein